MSHYSPSARSGAHDRVLSINWHLLSRRLRARLAQLFSSARHRAARTEYIPPSWMQQFHLTWFRIGLIGITVFVFTQKQIDFTVTLGAPAADDALLSDEGGSDAPATLSVLSGAGTATAPTKKVWSVTDFAATEVNAYVKRFAVVARTEEEKFAIPAPAKMAMAIVESQAGRATSATSDHNHFPAATAGQQYDNAWSSWRAHSQLIQRRFPELANESVNYQQWIDALSRTGYSRDPQYAKKLLAVIERFDLAAL